ncbi:TatD family hydrolase [Shewanella aestuarii]|uniref:YchF/TatD family DNA exonuclease n=1 Tax=Shewanella aestuarii TaxID=1028752 RepID=A0A6G9QHU3_9GAMM|nr:TatD family hydrolase [Shewanella aestuarii]QIR13449.1 YchF/TatD family DNA exonuclease [Shewanella aestuarii]
MIQHIDIAVNLLSANLIDNCHDIIQQAAKQDVSPLIVIGSELEESAQAINVCQQYPQQLFCTTGVHPHYARHWNEHSAETLKQLAKHPTVVAIGECGLDYNRDFSPRDQQRHAFAQQLDIACELNMPVYMHCRDAHDDFIDIVNRYRQDLPKAVLHCFTGNKAELDACLAADLYIGITGWICDERRGQSLAELVKYIPNNRLMAETDAPYLLPRSMRPKPKSSKNLPEYLPYIVQTMAKLRQQEYAELAGHCYQNSVDFFNLSSHG